MGVCVFVFHAKLKLKNAIDCSSEDNYQEDPLLSGARVGRFDTEPSSSLLAPVSSSVPRAIVGGRGGGQGANFNLGKLSLHLGGNFCRYEAGS